MENLGCKVKLIHSRYGFLMIRNVTEIHFNHHHVKERFLKKISLAIESDIHATGGTYDMDEVMEFETELEIEKAEKPEEYYTDETFTNLVDDVKPTMAVQFEKHYNVNHLLSYMIGNQSKFDCDSNYLYIEFSDGSIFRRHLKEI